MQLFQSLHLLQVLWRQSQGLFICVQSYRQCLVWSVCPWWGKRVCETDRESTGGRRTEGQDWLVGTICYRLCPCASVALHPHIIHQHSYLDSKSTIYWSFLAASHLSLNISQETYSQIRTRNRNTAQWVLDCSGRDTGRTTCINKNKVGVGLKGRGHSIREKYMNTDRVGTEWGAVSDGSFYC